MQWAWGGLSLEAGSGGDILTNVLSVKALTACERGEPPPSVCTDWIPSTACTSCSEPLPLMRGSRGPSRHFWRQVPWATDEPTLLHSAEEPLLTKVGSGLCQEEESTGRSQPSSLPRLTEATLGLYTVLSPGEARRLPRPAAPFPDAALGV